MGSRRAISLNSKISQKNVNHERFLDNPFFAGRDPTFLEAIMSELTIELRLAGETIIEEGDPGDSMYFLNNGSVEVLIEGGTKKLAELPPGSVFGEMCLLGVEKKRAATIKALELCDCRVISSKPFRYLLSRFPHESSYFADVAAKRKDALERERKTGDGDDRNVPKSPRSKGSKMSLLQCSRKASAINMIRRMTSDTSDRSSTSSVKHGRVLSDPVRSDSKKLSITPTEKPKKINRSASKLRQVDEDGAAVGGDSPRSSFGSESWGDELSDNERARISSLHDFNEPPQKPPSAAQARKSPQSPRHVSQDALQGVHQESLLVFSPQRSSHSPPDNPSSPENRSAGSEQSQGSLCPALPGGFGLNVSDGSNDIVQQVSPEVEHLLINLLRGGRKTAKVERQRRVGVSVLEDQPIMLKKLNTTVTKPQVPNLGSWRRHQKPVAQEEKSRVGFVWSFEPEEYPAAACGLLELPPLHP